MGHRIEDYGLNSRPMTWRRLGSCRLVRHNAVSPLQSKGGICSAECLPQTSMQSLSGTNTPSSGKGSPTTVIQEKNPCFLQSPIPDLMWLLCWVQSWNLSLHYCSPKRPVENFRP